MWLFMNNAMLSIVAHRGDPETLLVRARREGDIEAVFPAYETYTDDLADYRYRADVPRAIVASAVAENLLNIEYDNFKNSIQKDDHIRKSAYTEVWATMNHVQYIDGMANYEGEIDYGY